jgi:hypothetical protein
MDIQGLMDTAKATYLFDTTEQLYQTALQAIGLQPEEYILLDPLVEEGLLQAVLAAGARPIFIDFSPAGPYFDTQLLEDFLSLSTLVNAGDQLIYRKDEQIIRAIVLTQNGIPASILEQIKFIAQRYYLTIIEEFTQRFGEQESGKQGTISVAQVQVEDKPAGLLLQRPLPVAPFTLGLSKAKQTINMPKSARTLNEVLHLTASPPIKPNPETRLAQLQQYTFLSRNKIAPQLLQS